MPEKGNSQFGIEIECGVKSDRIRYDDVGEYHSNHLLSGSGGWRVEHDGSLDTDRAGYRMVELISPVFSFKTMESVFSSLGTRLGASTLDMPLYVNETCGAHIHFSWHTPNNRNNHLHWQIPERTLDFIRETTFTRMKETLPNVYPKFKSHYFRGFAGKRQNYATLGDYRRQEFFFSKSGGVEWRSFNLMGATTWRTMMEMIEIGCHSLDTGMKEAMYLEDEFTADVSPKHIEKDLFELTQKDKQIISEFDEGDYEYHEKQQ